METKQEVFNQLLEEYKQDMLEASVYTRLTDKRIVEEWIEPYRKRYEEAE